MAGEKKVASPKSGGTSSNEKAVKKPSIKGAGQSWEKMKGISW